MRRQQKFSVEDQSHIGEIRRAMHQWAEDHELGEILSSKISIVVNELSTNILKHAKRGEIIAVMDPYSISLISIDKGPGITNINEALRDGYSTHGTAGNGLGAVKRQSSEFDLFSRANEGTVVCARFIRPEMKLPAFECLGFALPVKGELVSGDSWTIVDESPAKILVADGLGHGLQAHDASRKAVETFESSSHQDPYYDVNDLHMGLRSTRGAAIAVAFVDIQKKVIEYCGLGNIVGSIISPLGVKRLVSYNGTAGVQMRKTQSLPYAFESNALLIMHSDGLTSHWSLSDYPGLILKHPLVIAGVLYRDFTRGNDDVTVVVGHVRA